MNVFKIDLTKETLPEAFGISEEKGRELCDKVNEERKTLLQSGRESALQGGGGDGYTFNCLEWISACYAHCESENELLFVSHFIGYNMKAMQDMQDRESPLAALLSALK